MIQSVSIKDTRDNLADLINRVAVAGEEFVVTKFGQPIAMLVPVSEDIKTDSISLDEVFGMWSDRKDIVSSADWVKQRRKKMSLRSKL